MRYRVLVGGEILASAAIERTRWAAQWARQVAGDEWELQRLAGEVWITCARSWRLTDPDPEPVDSVL